MKNKSTHLLFGLILLFVCIFIFNTYTTKKKIEDLYENAEILSQEKNMKSYNEALDIFKSIGDYKDCYNYIKKIEKNIDIYNNANELLENNQYELAMTEFRKIIDFDNSNEKCNEAKYKYASYLYDKKEYTKSNQYFSELGHYLDSEERAKETLLLSVDEKKEQIYTEAKKYMNVGDYSNALDMFKKLRDYKDCEKKIKECEDMIKLYDQAVEYYNQKQYIHARSLFEKTRHFNDSKKFLAKCNEKITVRKLSTTISSGIHYSVALKENGDVICTNNDYTFNNWHDILSVSGFGTMIIGLKEDGTVALEGRRDIYNTNKIDIIEADISEWKNIIQIDTGQQHVVGLKKDGTVVSDGLLTSPNWKNIRLITAGWQNTVGLDYDGKLYINGIVSKELTDGINHSKGKWNNIVSIDMGGGNSSNIIGNGHIVGLYDDGTVIAIGDNKYGQCNVYGDEWQDIVAVAAGDFHTVGLKSDGTVVATAPLNTEELPSPACCHVYDEKWNNIVAISAGYGTTIGLNKNGEIISAGFDKQNQLPKDDDENWKNIKIYEEWNEISKR